MELCVVWCPMSQRVGTVEVEEQIINYLIDKKKKVLTLGLGNFFKNKKNLLEINLLSEKFIKYSLKKSNILYGRFSVLIQSIKGFQEILKLFRKNNYTTLVVYTCLFPLPFLFLKSVLKVIKKEHKIKIINFIQGTPSFLRNNFRKKNIYFKLEDYLRKQIYKNFYANSNYIICSSKKLANQLENILNKDLIRVIPNGIIKNMPKKEKLLYLLNESIDKKIINLYFIGRLTFQKNIMRFLFEFNKLYMNDEKIFLKIIGDGDLYKKALKKYSKVKNISFKGYLKNPWEILEEDAIVIVPSLWEEPGHVPLEAFMNNKRFLISNGCSLSDFIEKDVFNKVVFDLNELHYTLKNIRTIANPKDWYYNFDKLYKNLENFSFKSFAKSLNEL